MKFLSFALLIVAFYCNRLSCNSITTENVKAARKSLGMSTMRTDENRTENKEMSWRDVPPSKQNPLKTEEMKMIADTKIDSSNRKTKILNSLVFLAGLANAASNAKAYFKSPPLYVNPDVSRLSSPIATIYDPHLYIPHPYVFTHPLGFYPLLNLLRLQAIVGAQNEIQTLTQTPQPSLLEKKKPMDMVNKSDKFIEEMKAVENVKTPSSVQEEADESVGLQVEDVRNAEEKMIFETACELQKRNNKKQGNPKVLEDEDSFVTEAPRAETTTEKPPKSAAQIAANQTAVNSTTMNPAISASNTTQNSTANSTETATPPFFGYYGGYPQNINHIDFTTQGPDFKYHDYDQVHYNLPSYEKPGNFYGEDKYNYYSNPTADSYAPNQFQQEQIPEFLTGDFNRFLYTSDNTPPFGNSGFRPVA